MRKRTCDRCKALKEAQGEEFECLLGVKIDGRKGIPFEECPKPLTYMQFIIERRLKYPTIYPTTS